MIAASEPQPKRSAATLRSDIHQYDFTHFVDDPPSIDQSGKDR
jgi:hypothetical protein